MLFIRLFFEENIAQRCVWFKMSLVKCISDNTFWPCAKFNHSSHTVRWLTTKWNDSIHPVSFSLSFPFLHLMLVVYCHSGSLNPISSGFPSIYTTHFPCCFSFLKVTLLDIGVSAETQKSIRNLGVPKRMITTWYFKWLKGFQGMTICLLQCF